MRAALIRRFTREGFNLTTAPMMRAGARAAEVVFALLHPRGTYRLRVGPRVMALEGREHDTPTGRCSSGSWGRLDSWSAPTTVGEVGALLPHVWVCILGEGTLSPTTFEGVRDYARGDMNRCPTRATADSPTPCGTAGSPGRGSVGKMNPSRLDAWGYAPATRERVGQHSPGKIRAAVRRERQREASKEYRNTRGSRTGVAQ